MPRSARFRPILLAILLGSAAIYFAGAQRVPLWDRDEPWYAECSREMLQSGNWVVPRFLGDWRLEKPPVIYWCQLAAMKVAGDTAQAARFPSTIAVLATVVGLALLVRRYVGPTRALWTAFIFCTSGLTIACAKFCITDGVLLFFVATGQACLAILYTAARRHHRPPAWTAPVFWISLGLAGITKGPQVLGMHFIALLILLLLDVSNDGKGLRYWPSWKNNLRWWWLLQPIIGLPILVAVVAPWLILIHRRAPGFLEQLLHTAKVHLAESAQGHGKPPGYHALLIFGTFFPWSLMLPATLIIAWKNRRFAAVRFAIAVTGGTWLMMELVYTKLPFYVLPAFPGLAFLTADALIRCARGQFNNLADGGFRATLIVWAIAVLGLGAAPWLSLKVAQPADLPIHGFIAFSLAAAAYAALVLLRFFQQRLERAAAIMGIGMGIMMLILYTAILPDMIFLHLPERLAADLTQLGASGSNVHVQMIGFDEPSLAFYQGGGARRPPLQADYFQYTPASQWPRWFVIADDADDWQRIPGQLRDRLAIRAVETGLNYSHEGKIVRVFIAENRAALSPSPGTPGEGWGGGS
jgi:4-amino-4-deoxy-L-arabinose transferase-like glycosyltransferase